MRMEETSELEEGEACSYKDDTDHIDPDTDLSYIDEKIEIVLGRHRRDFEGGVSAENLGAKYGGYGSFLPTYERSPTVWSYPKTPQIDLTAQGSPNTFPMEGASQNFKPTPDATSGAFPVKSGMQFSSTQVPEKIETKNESINNARNQTDQRTLKFRFKVGFDKMAQKKAEICSDLGLNISPSSSLDYSAEESEAKNPASQENTDESPTGILQVMTSFPVAGDALISPLHDSLLDLLRNELLSTDCEPESCSAKLECQIGVGSGKQSKEMKAKFVGKTKRLLEPKQGNELKHGFLAKINLENEIPGGKEIFDNDPLKGISRASKVFREAYKDEVRDKLSSADLVPDDSLESVSDSGKRQKGNGKGSSTITGGEQREAFPNSANPGYLGDNGSNKDVKVCASVETRSDESRCMDDHNVGAVAPPKQKVGKKSLTCAEDESNRKSKVSQSSGKAVAISIKESLGNVTDVKFKDNCKSKMHELKSQKDTNKPRDMHIVSLDKNLEQRTSQLEMLSSDRHKDSSLKTFKGEDKGNAVVNQVKKEKLRGRKVDNQTMYGVVVKDPCTMGSELASEVVPAVVPPVLIEENWVGCDRCQKWRLLPHGTKPEQLPDKWLCSMLNWLPGMNRCDISEDETTKALNALYQLPVAEGQNSLQNHARGNSSMITSAFGKYPEQKHHGLNSPAVSVPVKKKIRLKEISKGGGGLGRIQTLNSTKNKPPAESNIMRKSESIHLNKLYDLSVENNLSKQKEKNVNRVEVKQLKVENRVDVDESGYETSKKMKFDLYAADQHRKSDVDLKPIGGLLQSKASGRIKAKYEMSHSEGSKRHTKDGLLLSIKKLGDRIQVSSSGGSLHRKTNNKELEPLKKRKWHETEDGHEKTKVYPKGESSEGGSGRKKKLRIENFRDIDASNGNDNKSGKRNNKVIPPVDGLEGKLGKKLDSREDFGNLIKREVGGGDLSAAATSSSSKVSGSRKHRAPFEDVRSSPVESVTSSPVRTSYRDKFRLATEDIFGKDDDNDTGNQNDQKNISSMQKINEGSLLRSKGSDRNSMSNFDRGKHKVSNPLSVCGDLNPDKGMKHMSDVEFVHQNKNDSKSEKKRISGRESERPFSNDSKMDGSNVHLYASSNRKPTFQQNKMHDFEGEKVANRSQVKKRNEILKLESRSDSEHGAIESCYGDVSKISIQQGIANTNGNLDSLGHCTPDFHAVKDINVSGPRSMKFSSQTANNTLMEAKEVRNYADRFKSSGFDFESNEAYFQAALKFLHGASLLENRNGDSGCNGDMAQIQVYSTSAKLCESCAREYERRQEMAAAALAYKCMEVAYMRIVYCKSSSLNRDRNELQATFNAIPQGESPSSSASDVDNLNNQVPPDKAALFKGTVPHVTGSHMILARNRPNFIRLLDFTHDVSSAMEASRKSQNAFALANVKLEEAQNKECVATLKRVIDFSFQDIEELVNLVRVAMEIISRSGFHGAKD